MIVALNPLRVGFEKYNPRRRREPRERVFENGGKEGALVHDKNKGKSATGKKKVSVTYHLAFGSKGHVKKKN